MSKCEEEFLETYGAEAIPQGPLDSHYSVWVAWKYAWNARGNMDAGIARDFHENIIRDDCVLVLANTIEMKNEQ